MRKYLGLAALVVALAIPATAAGAYLHEAHQNSKCPTGYIGWHFVNNQLNGAANGYLTAVFSTGTVSNVLGEKKGPVGGGTIHWTVFTPAGATLINAWSDSSSGASPDPGGVQIAGKLVLSNCVKKG